MRIVCISDTYELHRQLTVPPGDLLIHAGGFTFYSKRPWMYRHFDLWLGELPHRHKVVIPGNHEYQLEEPGERSVITNATLLVDSSVTIEGLRIWGSPVTPSYGGAFGMSRAPDRRRHWARIPEGLDILIAHGPPFGLLNHSPGSERRDGCPELLEGVLEVQTTAPRVLGPPTLNVARCGRRRLSSLTHRCWGIAGACSENRLSLTSSPISPTVAPPSAASVSLGSESCH